MERTRRSRVTAGELMARLEQDPAHLARMVEKERGWAEARAHYLKVAAPVLADLALAAIRSRVSPT